MFKSAKKANAAIENESVAFLSGLCTDIEKNSVKFQAELSRLLQSKTFLPSGGTLGFGLSKKYTWSETDGYISGSGITGLYKILTPADKLLYTIGQTTQLGPRLKIVYTMKDYPGVSLLSANLSPFPGEPYPYESVWENTQGLSGLCKKIEGDIVVSTDKSCKLTAEVDWVKPVHHVNNRLEYIEKIAGEKTISHVSRSYVLTMVVPKWVERQGAGSKRPRSSEESGREQKVRK